MGVGMDVNEIADCIAESIAIAENVLEGLRTSLGQLIIK